MSINPQTTPGGEQPLSSTRELLDYFHKAGKPRSAWRVGGEFEKFALDAATGRQIGYPDAGGVRDVLSALAERFDWEAVREEGQVTTLLRGNSSVSIEPGGQLELATAPAATASGVAGQLREHLAELRAVSRPGLAWAGVGVTPYSRPDEIPLVPRRRHAVMAEYLPARGSLALHMMKATASTQAAFDYSDETDGCRKMSLALRLSPLVGCLWANAPVWHGGPAGVPSQRARVWQEMDPDRSGLLADLVAGGLDFARWVDYLLNVPMMFVYQNGTYLSAGGATFRDYMSRGVHGEYPTAADWELHLTTVFPEARMKKFIEVRGADAGRFGMSAALPAFWRGLLYDAGTLAGAEAVAGELSAGLIDAAVRHGLAGVNSKRTLAQWCGELVELSAAGLRRLDGPGGPDVALLEPLREQVERGVSPGTEFPLELLADPPAVVRWFDYGG